MKQRKILIVGGGIAGAALGIKLLEQGAQVTIIEARKEAELEEGLFMGISPNGLKILEELVNRDQLYNEYAPGKLQFFNARGRQIATLDTLYQLQKYGRCTIQIKRETISKLLHTTLQVMGNSVEYDCKLHAVSYTEDKIYVETSGGVIEDYDLLIAADGLHSKCRRLLFPDSPHPTYSKMVSTGAVIQIPDWKDDSGMLKLTFGRRAFFGYATSSKNQVWWFNNFYCENEPDRVSFSDGCNGQIKDHLITLHKDDHKCISEIIRSTDYISVYPMYDMQPLKKWYGKQFCLIGDAAHAIPPHTGQGASLALEDAAVLAKCLEKYHDPEIAFENFQNIREPRVRKVLSQTKRVGQTKINSNMLTSFFRDRFMKRFIHLENQKMDWIYSYEVSKLNI